MNIQQDFEELLKLLEQNKVNYMVVGGYAVAFHGFPRFTQDIDIYFSNLKENIKKLRKALIQFGFSESEIPEDIFIEKGNILQFGITPVRIDLINEIDGIEYQMAEKSIIRGKYGSIKINFIGRKELIINKKASGRSKDIIDVEELEK